jgi:hypothetical protein
MPLCSLLFLLAILELTDIDLHESWYDHKWPTARSHPIFCSLISYCERKQHETNASVTTETEMFISTRKIRIKLK